MYCEDIIKVNTTRQINRHVNAETAHATADSRSKTTTAGQVYYCLPHTIIDFYICLVQIFQIDGRVADTGPNTQIYRDRIIQFNPPLPWVIELIMN